MAFYGWISDNPKILYHTIDEPDFHEHLPEDRVYRLCRLSWHYHTEGIVQHYERARAVRPKDVLVYLPNEGSLHTDLQKRGIPSVHVNATALVDERVFRILPDVEKTFDAVYVARMARFKQHLLARRVPKLLLVGSVRHSDDEHDYLDGLRAALPNAFFTCGDRNKWLRPEEVVHSINQARVGLCLSALEGAMNASVECLLCGLPMVSTQNKGGRDEFLGPEYSRTVPDDPEVIAEAVRELIAMDLRPEWVRQQTLLRMGAHRQQFIDLVQNIFDYEGVSRHFRAEFSAGFYSKLGDWRQSNYALHYLATDAGRFTRPEHSCEYKSQESNVFLPPCAARAPVASESENHLAEVALAIPSADFATVWQSVQYAHYLQRTQKRRVSLYARWPNLPGFALSPATSEDRAPLAQEMAAVLDVPESITIAANGAAKLKRIGYAALRPFPHLRTRPRWQDWAQGPHRRLAYYLGPRAKSADGPAGRKELEGLRDFAPGYAVIAVDEGQPVAVMVEVLCQCDLFIACSNELTSLCLAVGVPVFLVGLRPELVEKNPWPGELQPFFCSDALDFISKARSFLDFAG